MTFDLKLCYPGVAQTPLRVNFFRRLKYAAGHMPRLRWCVRLRACLGAAIRAGEQARVNQLTGELSNEVAKRVTKQLNRSFSFYDDWVDPVIGLRGRFNLNKAFYLTAESDVGGFGIGSDIAVQVYAALGCQITRNMFSEVGYRYYYDDFRDESANGFLYQLALHGAQITLGIKF
jgi:hypothetical protein